MMQNMFEFFGEDIGFGIPEEIVSAGKKEKKEKKEKKPNQKVEKKTGEFDIALPVTVLARGFKTMISDDEKQAMKISDVFKSLDEEGYNEVRLPGIDCAYDKNANILYITTNGVTADADGTQVEFPETDEIVILDGMNKCELTAENFPGKDKDEISCLDLTEYWTQVDSRYRGCKMYYNAGIAYPVFSVQESDKEKVALPVSVMVNGEWHDISEADFAAGEVTAGALKKKFFGMENTIVSPVLYANINKSAYFLSYSQKKTSTSSKGYIGTEKAEKKKVEEKYTLPVDVFIATFGRTYTLTPDDFQGKGKISITDVKKYFESIYKIFADKSRKLDVIYLKEENLLSLNFISGKKGSFDYMQEEHERYGTHELIRSLKELKDVIKRPFFSGTLVNYKEYPDSFVQIESFPIGTFLLEKESEKQSIKSIRFEYKLPKIPVNVLEMVIEEFRQDIDKEAYCKLCYSNKSKEYFLIKGEQKATSASVIYSLDSSIFHNKNIIQVMDIHSHNKMGAFFSEIDNIDECYPGIFAVIGKLHHNYPQLKMRAGYEGYFTSLKPAELFEGTIPCQCSASYYDGGILHGIN